MANYIDVTPTWEGLVPSFRMVIENTEQPIHREAMWSEIERMAKLADLYVASQRSPVVPTQAIDETAGELKIGGIPASAPLWRNTTPETLVKIVKCLSDASFHYADDSGQEWGRARKLVVEAATLVNAHRLDFDAMRYLHADKPQLVDLGTLVDAVLKELRRK